MSSVAAAAAAPASPTDDKDSVIARTRRRVLLLTLALVVAASVAFSYNTARLFRTELAPEVLRKSQTMADFLAADAKLAVGYGIPLDKLVGVSAYFDEKRAGHPEIKFIAILGSDGRPLYTSGTYLEGSDRADVETAARELITGRGTSDIANLHDFVVMHVIRGATGPIGALVIGNDPDYVSHQLQDLIYDIGIILLVALFLAFEIAVALLATSAVAPLNQLLTLMRAAGAGDLHRRMAYRANNDIGRAISQFNRVVERVNGRYQRLVAGLSDAASEPKSRLTAIGERFGLTATGTIATRIAAAAVDVRLPLFVFILAEEMQKPFLPLYVRSLEGNLAWLSQEVLIGLPISVYMLTLALVTPFAGSWADHAGARRIFVVGLVPALVGFLGAAFAHSVLELIAARALTAVGYAMCTIAAQGFIIQVTPSKERAQGMSVFVGVLMSANICGTAIGGLLADRLGYRAVFVCSAVLAFLAGSLAMRMLPPIAPGLSGGRSGIRLADVRVMVASWRFVGLAVFAAIPAKIILTGFLFYAVPLYLEGQGISEAEIGRIMMVYSLVIVFAGPWLSKVSDRGGYARWMVFAGTLFSGLAMLILLFRSDHYGVLAAVFVVALAHAASISPQIALLPEIAKQEIERVGETTVLSIMRMVERIGSVIGPIMVAALVTQFGFVHGLTVVGGYLVVLSLLLLTSYVGLPRRPSE